MFAFLSSLNSQFNASALKIASEKSPVTIFEKFHALTLDYRTPIIASILYVLVVSYFSKLNRERSTGGSSGGIGKRVSSRNNKNSSNESGKEESRFTPFKCLVIAHNVFLCLYSASVFLSALPILARPYFNSPILEAYCDVQKKTFNSGVHFWVWNFYVSKYYELLDTAILLIKGKPSSFLQTFHHSGSILGMWMLTTTHAPAGWIFVLFNSFIHTIMYFYYTLTCLGYRPTWKKILTTMQIVQFCVGNPLGLIYAFIPDCLPLEIIPPENVVGKLLGGQVRSLYACLFVNTFFISSLVILFTDFSRKTYGTTDKNDSKKEKSPKVSVKSIKAIKEPKAKESKAKESMSQESKTKESKPSKSSKTKSSVLPGSPKKSVEVTKPVKKSKKESSTSTESPVTTRRSRRS